MISTNVIFVDEYDSRSKVKLCSDRITIESAPDLGGCVSILIGRRLYRASLSDLKIAVDNVCHARGISVHHQYKESDNEG